LFVKLLLLTVLQLHILFGVPVFSEVEEVKGEVVQYSVARFSEYGFKPPDKVVYVITISLKSKKKPVFMKKNQQFLRVFSKKPIPSWVFGKSVTLQIKFSGDERGGSYWLIKIKEVK